MFRSVHSSNETISKLCWNVGFLFIHARISMVRRRRERKKEIFSYQCTAGQSSTINHSKSSSSFYLFWQTKQKTEVQMNVILFFLCMCWSNVSCIVQFLVFFFFESTPPPFYLILFSPRKQISLNYSLIFTCVDSNKFFSFSSVFRSQRKMSSFFYPSHCVQKKRLRVCQRNPRACSFLVNVLSTFSVLSLFLLSNATIWNHLKNIFPMFFSISPQFSTAALSLIVPSHKQFQISAKKGIWSIYASEINMSNVSLTININVVEPTDFVRSGSSVLIDSRRQRAFISVIIWSVSAHQDQDDYDDHPRHHHH